MKSNPHQRTVPVYQKAEGFVLIVVLWAVAIVTIITLGFGHRAILDTTAATYSVDYAQAMMLAHGAAERGILEVRNKLFLDKLAQDPEGKLPPPGTFLGQPWAQPGDLFKDDMYFSKQSHGANDIATYSIVDAERYLNIAGADEAVLRRSKLIKPGLLKKIMVRRKEETVTGEGISPFQAEEELRYLEGVDDDAWFGSKKKPGLCNNITLVGSGLININTASADVLACVPDLTPDAIQRILAYRRGPDGQLGTADDLGFGNYDVFQEKIKLQGEGGESVKKYCTFDSTFFIITGTATRQGGKVRASCTVTVYVDGNSAAVLGWKEDVLGA